MKLFLCISAVVVGAHSGATAAESVDYLREIKPLLRAQPEPDPREHWSFKRPTRPVVPQLRQSPSVIRNSIDSFIFAEHEKRGLTPAPEARKEVLVRRVYLDLIGVPPTREELHACLADTSSDAYEKIVNRLLASPQYAERWARHWMDIWRYADWYGRRHVPDVWNSAPQVWRWRDWIVRSLNADKGYDRMIVEMLAADEVAPEDDEARVATGYLVRNWYALNPNQWMRDIVEHTGKAFLGLTFNCAHCHDHKYDPISHRDYFQFRAFFEPLQVRQDWVKGEANPGPFQKYEYSALRKAVTNGIVSVFDENLDAKTFIYLGGDERRLPEGKPVVEPMMPAFLGGDSLKPQRLDLPVLASYPGLKPFIREAEVRKREQALTEAKVSVAAEEKALTEARAKFAASELTNALASRAKAFADLLVVEVSLRKKRNQLAIAQAELEAVRARIAADDARYSGNSTSADGRSEYGVPALAGAVSENSGALANSHSAPAKAGYLFSGVWPSSATASSPFSSVLKGSNAKSYPSVAAPGDGRTPLNTYKVGTPYETASRAERLLAFRQAEAKLAEAESTLTLLQAEQAIGTARRLAEGSSAKKEDQAAAEASVKKVREQAAAAQKAVETAQAALKTNSAAYTLLGPAYPTQSTGRRRALAGWIASRDNPLTARVAVNHIWARHFHAPLVSSVFDFGRNGASPTHPELLDWLAVEFMEHGWSMKHLHRLIVTSSAYRQSSAATGPRSFAPEKSEIRNQKSEMEQSLQTSAATNKERDPENRYLWHMNPGQMEAEVVRDSILYLASELDLTTVGYPLPNAQAEKSRHRSLYFECFPEPNGQSQFAEMFDAPNPTECYRRSQTIVPQQALALINSKLSTERSRVLAQRLTEKLMPTAEGSETDFLTAAFEQILSRLPTDEELAACREFVVKQTKITKPEVARASLVQALFNHNDFIAIR